MQDGYYTFTYQPMHGLAGAIDGVMIFSYDVTVQVVARKKTEKALAQLQGQKRILGLVAEGRPLRETLAQLSRSIEGGPEGVKASILLLERDGSHLLHGAAPELPDPFNLAMGGTEASPQSNWCGVSAFNGERIMISDLAADPRWQEFRDPALAIGIKACGVIPILSSQGKVLGIFTIYYPTVMDFHSEEMDYVDLLVGIAAIAIERRQAEEDLTQTQEHLAQSQKMDAVGKLAGGIAHEFNNMLVVINGYTELLLASSLSLDDQRSYLGEIKQAGRRAADLTSQILAFSRKQVLTPKLLVLNEVVGGMQLMLQQLIGENIEFQVVSPPVLTQVLADRGQVEQVILNLVLNARDAMPYGGRLTLGMSNVHLDEEAVPSIQGSPGDYVLLTVSDTGNGMDAATQARIFEPFFSTKAVGRGTGLGLSIAEGIIKQSGGHIQVISVPGKGSIFRVYLPVAKFAKSHANKPTTTPIPVLGRGEAVILVVEDEAAVRRLVCHTLKAQGYSVWEASCAEEAMKWQAEHSTETVHLLLTDLVMPGVSGRVLAENLQALRPDMKVLYMSGYTEDLVLRHGVEEEGFTFIGKPFTFPNLIQKIEDVLKDSLIRNRGT